MQDINSMSMKEFRHLNDYIKRRDKINKHEPVALRDSNKRMIDNYKKKEGK